MIILTIFLVCLSIILIANTLGIREVTLQLYKEDIIRFRIHWNTRKELKGRFPKQYERGYKFLMSICIYKLRVGFTVR